MKFKPIFGALLPFLGVLVACGGSQKPAVEPAVAPADTVAAQPAKADLNNPTDRYSYALGMDLGKAVANINVPLNIPVLMDAILDQVDSNRSVLMTDSVAELPRPWFAIVKDYAVKYHRKQDYDFLMSNSN